MGEFSEGIKYGKLLNLSAGHDIVFISPSNSPKIHTPDIKMDGVEWEMKSPTGKSKRTIEQSFRKAVSGSLNRENNPIKPTSAVKTAENGTIDCPYGSQ